MIQGMNAALRFVEDHLDHDIDLKEVAQQAYCSEYHFKRLFSLVSGITISEYIRSRRLAEAAVELRQPGAKVIDVAVKYGYQSPDAFSRAFQQFHGVKPSMVRQSGQTLKAYPRMTFQLTIQGGVEMKYRIVRKEAFQVVGLNYRVEMKGDILTPSYEEMLSAISDVTMQELESLSSPKEPSGIVHVTVNYAESAEGKATFQQYIGAVTDKHAEGYSALQIPSLEWAVFEVEGEWAQVEETWQRIYSEWLPSSNYELVEGAELLASRDHKSEIWVSVQEKQ